ncbi:transposase [Streptomyces griseorubiginosus]|uniref:transposase n=1 Tax=Streptomyces griseorubiginosus TaxID=67304 RepID=UPI0036A66A12
MPAPTDPPSRGVGRGDRLVGPRDRAAGEAGHPRAAETVRCRPRDRRAAADVGRRQPRTHAFRGGIAHLAGVAPIPASSGRTHRQRLNRGGDRAANNALDTIVLVRLRFNERARRYVERRTKEGLNRKAIMRCLKRFVAREVYRALTATPTERITQTDLAPTA